MIRFIPWRVWLGHWRGLSDRSAGPGRALPSGRYPAATLERIVDLVLPWLLGVITALTLLWPGARTTILDGLDAGLGGAVVGGASLLLAGLLTTFSQLGSWRSRYTDRMSEPDMAKRSEYLARDWHVRCLIDEAVAHALWGIIDVLVVVVATVVAMVAGGYWSVGATCLVVVAGTHLGVLLLVLTTRLYSAYCQAEQVDAALSGEE
jgi:membrane associated rhomboid family serine protease